MYTLYGVHRTRVFNRYYAYNNIANMTVMKELYYRTTRQQYYKMM